MSEKQDQISEMDLLVNEDISPIDKVTSNNIDKDCVPLVHSIHKEPDVKPYDVNVKHVIVPDRLTTLEIINERFARQFKMGLFNLLRKGNDVIVHTIETETLQEFTAKRTAQTLFNLVHFTPLKGASMFIFEPKLVFILVDSLFGGGGDLVEDDLDNREFTYTEQQVIKRVLNLALTFYQQAWTDIYAIDIEHARTMSQLNFTKMTSQPEEKVLTSTFTIEMGEFKGEFCIGIPYSMVEPIKDILVTPPLDKLSQLDDGTWRHSLASGIKHSTVELVANFAEIDTTVDSVLGLTVGDILIIEKPTEIEVTIGGVPIIKGQHGKVNKQYAIQVEQVITTALEQFNGEILS